MGTVSWFFFFESYEHVFHSFIHSFKFYIYLFQIRYLSKLNGDGEIVWGRAYFFPILTSMFLFYYFIYPLTLTTNY